MATLLNNDGQRHPDWIRALKVHLPDTVIYEYPEVPSPEAISYALVWNHPKGDLCRYPNLKAVLSLGAGTEHFDMDPHLPEAPIIRLVDRAMAEDMALYALYWSLHFQRQMGLYQIQHTQKTWQRHTPPITADYKICVLGLGAIGAIVAKRLSDTGFSVAGWARTTKSIDGVESFTENSALHDALSVSDILVNCLPLTPQTRRFLNHDRLAFMKPASRLINIGRGPTIDMAALLDHLDSGHIKTAVLDVFEHEPLPKNSILWNHADIIITPHISGATNPFTAARVLAETIHSLERGEIPPHIYTPPQHNP